MNRLQYMTQAANAGGFRYAMAQAAEHLFSAYVRADSANRRNLRETLRTTLRSYACAVEGWPYPETQPLVDAIDPPQPRAAPSGPQILVMWAGVAERTHLWTWLADNDFTFSEVLNLMEALHEGDTYHGGGGAFPEWSVRLADAERATKT